MIKYYKQIYTLGNIALRTILSITTVNMHSFHTAVSHTQAPIETFAITTVRTWQSALIITSMEPWLYQNWVEIMFFWILKRLGEILGAGCEGAVAVCLKGARVRASWPHSGAQVVVPLRGLHSHSLPPRPGKNETEVWNAWAGKGDGDQRWSSVCEARGGVSDMTCYIFR